MLAVLPYASLSPALLDLGPFHDGDRARLTYPELEDVSFLTPPLPFLHYDPDTSRITFDTSDQPAFAALMTAMQEKIATLLPKKGIPLLSLYQRDRDALTLFTNSTTTLQRPEGTLAPLGAKCLVRCAVRLSAVHHHTASNTYRIQHSILKLWSVSMG